MQMDEAGTAGPALVAIGVIFMVTVNVGVGAAFLAIGAALTAQKARADGSSECAKEEDQ